MKAPMNFLSGSLTHRAPAVRLALCALAASALAACGGGGGLDEADTQRVRTSIQGVTGATEAGGAFSVSGTAISQPNLLSEMRWSVTKLSASAPDLTLGNANCADAQRSNQTTAQTSRSEWSCSLAVIAPSALSREATYRLTLTGVDAGGNSGSVSRDIRIAAGGEVIPVSPPPVVTTTSAVSVFSGDDVGLNCNASGGALDAGKDYIWRWSVRSNPSALLLNLNSDEHGGVTFKAPSVRNATTVTLQCLATDSAFGVGAAQVAVTINPAPGVSLVADAGVSRVVGSNEFVMLSGGVSGQPDGATVYYRWRQISGPSIQLNNPDTSGANFFAPNVTQRESLVFELIARTVPDSFDAHEPSERSTVTVYVMPGSSPKPLVLQASDAQVAPSGQPVTISVNASNETGALYYRWTQVSGPPVTLAGANTARASFIAPTLATSSAQELLFAVSVSRVPLDQADPDEIFGTDAVVSVTP